MLAPRFANKKCQTASLSADIFVQLFTDRIFVIVTFTGALGGVTLLTPFTSAMPDGGGSSRLPTSVGTMTEDTVTQTLSEVETLLGPSNDPLTNITANQIGNALTSRAEGRSAVCCLSMPPSNSIPRESRVSMINDVVKCVLELVDECRTVS